MQELIVPFIIIVIGYLIMVFSDTLRRKGKFAKQAVTWVRIAGICTFAAGYFLPMFTLGRTLPYYAIPIGILVGFCGVYIIANSFKTLGRGVFLGADRLVTDGPYRIMRNPIYFGALLIFLGAALISGVFLSIICIGIGFLFFIPYIKKEEKELYHKFGEAYLEYKKEVPPLIPIPGKRLK
jgi:protein-S-isoprenylcysteine O-methyltransferase Ste14